MKEVKVFASQEVGFVVMNMSYPDEKEKLATFGVVRKDEEVVEVFDPEGFSYDVIDNVYSGIHVFNCACQDSLQDGSCVHVHVADLVFESELEFDLS